VDGSDPATTYRGLLTFDETPNVIAPATGWVFNVNNWPWSAAGRGSLARAAFPRYVETATEESPRGLHALCLLEGSRDWTLRSLAAAAFDPHLPSFERLVPRLLEAFDRTPASDPLRTRLTEQLGLLRDWDFRWSASSIPTSLAVHWGETLARRVEPEARAARMPAQTFIAERVPPAVLLEALATASDSLVAAFGTWRMPWGELNRFQRIGSATRRIYDDREPSLPVPFTSGVWGSLASFGARPQPGTRKRYGTAGNSFVAVVEFADRVRAIAVTAGGASGHPDSKHFADQAARYASGDLREVYFWPERLRGHVEREYRPGRSTSKLR
jgi:acyl-homoserine-lactone acylase